MKDDKLTLDNLTVATWERACESIYTDITDAAPIVNLLDAYDLLPTDNPFYEHVIVGAVNTVRDKLGDHMERIRRDIIDLALRLDTFKHKNEYKITYAVADVGWSLSTDPSVGVDARFKLLKAAADRLSSVVAEAKVELTTPESVSA